MKYLITGATGFIGGRVARQLCQAGHQVVAVVRQPERARGLAALGVELHQGDITDQDSLRTPMRGVDGVFHIAGWYKLGTRDRDAFYRVNVQGTRNVLELALQAHISQTVYTSSLAVFSDTRGQTVDETYYHGGPWINEYDRTKWLAHYEVAVPMMKAGLPLVIVLPGLVYGPGDASPARASLVQYLRRRLPMTPRGAAVCWGHVDDVARGHIVAMEKGRSGESYVIAGPAHRLSEALEVAERITGVPAPKLHSPPALIKFLAAGVALVEKVHSVPAMYSSDTLSAMAGVTYLASSAKAQRELGFVARPLEEGLRETLEHEMKLLGMKPT